MTDDDQHQAAAKPSDGGAQDDASGKWSELLASSHAKGVIRQDAASSTQDAAPNWLLERLPQLREAAATMARALLWQRWSWITAVAAVILLLIVWLLLRDNGTSPADGSPIIPPVEIVDPFDP